MKITVVGAGYVGLVTGLSLAEQGQSVTLLDLDEARIAQLQQGLAPIYESGLNELLNAQIAAGRVTFTTRYEDAIPRRDMVFICVGTPSDESGGTDLTYLSSALQAMVPFLDGECTVVIKSTVPVGTNRWAHDLLAIHSRQVGMPWRTIDVVSNPEFLREGNAVWDSRNPERIVIGARHTRSFHLMTRLYSGFSAPILRVSPEEAELTKYAANAFLAQKISFINVLADLCEVYGADIRNVAQCMGMDPRIGPQFLSAGLGFGGSCFPKDLRSLLHQLRQHQLPTTLFEEVLRINRSRIERAASRLEDALGGLQGRRIALLGLAFKPHTDDTRESQSLQMLETLLGRSADVTAYDPKAMEQTAKLFPKVTYAESATSACDRADAVVIATDWPEFASLPWKDIILSMRSKVILDCRNQLDGVQLTGWGARYLGMGVPSPGGEKA